MSDELRRGPSGPVVELTTDTIINTSSLGDEGSSLTVLFDLIDGAGTALPPGYPPTPSGDSSPATAGRPGFVSRVAYVNAASDRIGTTFAGVTVEAAPASWTTEEEIPPGGFFIFAQFGSAGGSGSGSANRGGSGGAQFGGGPSGGGALNLWSATRAELIAQLPIVFTAPLGGLGGASVTGTSSSTTVGNPGAPGVNCVVSGAQGLLEIAGAGLFGTGGTASSTGDAGSGGGRYGAGIGTTQGGPPFDQGATVNNTTYNLYGGARSNTRASNASSGISQWSIWGGAGGGSNGNQSLTINGGRSQYGGSGGGHGGRITITPSITQVSAGGSHDVTLLGTAPGGGGGGAAGSGNGGAGGDGDDGSALQGGEGGGGGQAAVGATAETCVGGTGGAGGFPGGGSGGGGAALSTNVAVNSLSGPGRKGADGAIIITGY